MFRSGDVGPELFVLPQKVRPTRQNPDESPGPTRGTFSGPGKPGKWIWPERFAPRRSPLYQPEKIDRDREYLYSWLAGASPLREKFLVLGRTLFLSHLAPLGGSINSGGRPE